MTYNKRYKRFSLVAIFLLFSLSAKSRAVEFYNELLSASDQEGIDISKFSDKDYILPGAYTLAIRLNNFLIAEDTVNFVEKTIEGKSTVNACLTPEQIQKFGIREEYYEQLISVNDNGCIDFHQMAAVIIKPNLGTSSLDLIIPKEYLEYSDQTWVPPSRWDDGLPGGLFDYNISGMITKPSMGSQYQNFSGNGTLGINAGSWRTRAEWQASYRHTTGNHDNNYKKINWTQIYAYRALRRISATMNVGEDFVRSDIFDSWRYAGISIASDDKMLPPQMRGFSPEVTGIARTNARVIISQKGHVVYETTVPSGAFRIQEISSALNGVLDVKVEEQDGSVQNFQVDAVTTPFLTRPGQLRYKLSAGRPEDNNRHLYSSTFVTGELSLGINNNWSVYGGSILASDYQAFALGVGLDLHSLGTLSADITQAFAQLDQGKRQQGKAWRVNYSKRFQEQNSEVTFTGYRFSERDYLSMDEFLSDKYTSYHYGHGKSLYTITGIKTFPDLRLSTSLSWGHQTYWDRKDQERYSVSVNQFFDAWDWHNLAVTFTANRTESRTYKKDDSIFLSLSVPMGKGSLSYSGASNNGTLNQNIGWSERLDNGDNYRLQTGVRSGNGDSVKSLASGIYSHYGDMADVSTNMSWVQGNYFSAGLSAAGGITATQKGVALHPGTGRGNTRLMISTNGIADVPIEQNQRTNAMGIAVVPNYPSFYRHSTAINVNKLPDDIENIGSPVAEAALTAGAIGYRELSVLKGHKLITIFRKPDGTYPPLGAQISNKIGQEIGIVGDEGFSWVAGINEGDMVTVSWGLKNTCRATIPALSGVSQLLLPCQSVTEKN